jgi:voltage-gated potassium channel Kch
MTNARPDSPVHGIIAGFGLPGRSIAELLDERGLAYTVIETNPETVERCTKGGLHIISGDVRDPQTLRQAGIEHAAFLALTMPSDEIVQAAITAARNLNRNIRIVARCSFISAGLKAIQLGADETVVAEQAVAREFSRLIARNTLVPPASSTPTGDEK